jgi:hypothetical protein
MLLLLAEVVEELQPLELALDFGPLLGDQTHCVFGKYACNFGHF